MITGKDIIMFGLQPWDISIGSNFKNMAEEVANYNRVLYVNYPADRVSLYRFRNDARIKNRINSIKNGEGVLTEVKKNLFVFNPRTVVESINWLPSTKLFNFLNYNNSKRLAKEINWAIKAKLFKNPLLLIDNDFLKGFYLPDLIDHELFVFYIRDFLLHQSYFKKHGKVLEKKMIEKADVVVCNSAYLAEYANKYNDNSFDIGQGCDVESFMKEQTYKPEELKDVKGPIIGYCGSLTSSRLDIELLSAIATQHPEWSIVLVGPEDEDFQKSVLHKFTNVYFLGTKPAHLLPAYVQAFSVCINPQLVNDLTLGNYPRKVDEYLAAGKPVVVTATPAMTPFKNYVYLCETFADYTAGITKALSERANSGLIANRKKFAQSHTWEASVNKLYTAIEGIQHKKRIVSYEK